MKPIFFVPLHHTEGVGSRVLGRNGVAIGVVGVELAACTAHGVGVAGCLVVIGEGVLLDRVAHDVVAHREIVGDALRLAVGGNQAVESIVLIDMAYAPPMSPLGVAALLMPRMLSTGS